MRNNQPNQKNVQKIYRALVPLGAENDLLGTVGSWGDSLPDGDVQANLKSWNMGTLSHIKERIGHYETTFPHPAYSLDESRRTSLQAQ
jgi:hypothetical protein